MNGSTAIRGYIVQTLVALFDALKSGDTWLTVSLEPNHVSEKIDILWHYADGTKRAVQVKSSQYQINKTDVQRWADDLQSSTTATTYDLVLVGPCSEAVTRMKRRNLVRIPPPLNIAGLETQVREQIAEYLELEERASTVSTRGRKLLVQSLCAWLQDLSTSAAILTRDDFRKTVSLAVSELRPVSSKYNDKLLNGISSLPIDYAARIANFLELYRGTAKSPVPFGGREEAIQEFDCWLADNNAPRYRVLVAPAGRGKSALLVNWTERLQTSDELEVIFIPISSRCRTNLASVVFPSLVARLARLHEDPVPRDPHLATEQWRNMVNQYLRSSLPSNKRLVIILDGVDEAADWEGGSDLFPLDPPDTLRVVVSARPRPDDHEGSYWQRIFGWQDKPELADACDLKPLDPNGVADVLNEMGFPLDQLGKRGDVVQELYRLSEGDPLLVNLYVLDLWKKGAESARLKPADLHNIQPGLKGYFDRWWEDQKRIWGHDSPLRSRTVAAVLYALACALAPLPSDDLVEISQLQSMEVEGALSSLSRFVFGDGRTEGYSFSHPRFANFFHDKLTAKDRNEWQGRFLCRGRQVLDDLESGILSPQLSSSYVISHYGAHLERANADPDDLLPLTRESWQLAWEAHADGALTGFLNDVNRAWRACTEANLKAMLAGTMATHLGSELQCALIRSSIISVSSILSPQLLVSLVQNEIWSPTRVVTYTQQKPQLGEQIATLLALTPFLRDPMRTDVVELALVAATKLVDARSHRGSSNQEGQAKLADLSRFLIRAKDLLASARDTPEPSRSDILQDICNTLKGRTEYWVSPTLHRISPIPKAEIQELLDAAKVGDIEEHARVLSALCAHLSSEQRTKALAKIPTIRDECTRPELLATLDPHTWSASDLETIKDALMTVKALWETFPAWSDYLVLEFTMGEGTWRKYPVVFYDRAVLSSLAQQRTQEEIQEIIDWAQNLSHEVDMQRVFCCMLASQSLDETQRSWMTAKALTTFSSHFNSSDWETIVCQPLEEHMRVAIDVVTSITDEVVRAEALARLIPHLDAGLVQDAWKVIQELRDPIAVAVGWCGADPVVWHGDIEIPLRRAEELLDSATLELVLWTLRSRFNATEDFGESKQFSEDNEKLVPLACFVSEADGAAILRASLEEIRQKSDEGEQAKALVRLAPYFHGQYAVDALAVAERIDRPDFRGWAMSALVPQLDDECVRDVATEAVEIEEVWVRPRLLSALASRLSRTRAVESYGVWQILLECLSRRPRTHLLADIAALLPMVRQFGGTNSAAEVFDAITRCGSRWP